MLLCDIYNKSSWAKACVCEWGRDEVMFMCAHVHDVALCSNTVRNVALCLWLVSHSCFTVYLNLSNVTVLTLRWMSFECENQSVSLMLLLLISFVFWKFLVVYYGLLSFWMQVCKQFYCGKFPDVPAPVKNALFDLTLLNTARRYKVLPTLDTELKVCSDFHLFIS